MYRSASSLRYKVSVFTHRYSQGPQKEEVYHEYEWIDIRKTVQISITSAMYRSAHRLYCIRSLTPPPRQQQLFGGHDAPHRCLPPSAACRHHLRCQQLARGIAVTAGGHQWAVSEGWKPGEGHCLSEGRYQLPNNCPCFSGLSTPQSFLPPPIFEGHISPLPPNLTSNIFNIKLYV